MDRLKRRIIIRNDIPVWLHYSFSRATAWMAGVTSDQLVSNSLIEKVRFAFRGKWVCKASPFTLGRQLAVRGRSPCTELART